MKPSTSREVQRQHPIRNSQIFPRRNGSADPAHRRRSLRVADRVRSYNRRPTFFSVGDAPVVREISFRRVRGRTVCHLLLRLHTKDLLIKLNRTGHVSHIERDMRSHESLLSNKGKAPCLPLTSIDGELPKRTQALAFPHLQSRKQANGAHVRSNQSCDRSPIQQLACRHR